MARNQLICDSFAGAGQTQTFSKPTIIRPNRSRANQQSARMPPQTSHLEQLEKLSATTKSSLAGSIPNLLDLDSENSDSSDAASPDYSPPEPNIPPPALPPGFSTSGSPLPPRQPYAISLYKYQSGHPGDLDFQVRIINHNQAEKIIRKLIGVGESASFA